MAVAFEAQYGITVADITDWVGDSLTAYLTVEQLEAIRNDPRVVLITEDSIYSNQLSGPPWSDAPLAGSEIRSYGHVAVNGLFSGASYPRIYIVDVGVGYHQDLDNSNISRIVPYNPDPNALYVSQVGCYPHATHIPQLLVVSITMSAA